MVFESFFYKKYRPLLDNLPREVVDDILSFIPEEETMCDVICDSDDDGYNDKYNEYIITPYYESGDDFNIYDGFTSEEMDEDIYLHRYDIYEYLNGEW